MHMFFKSNAVELGIILKVTAKDMMLNKKSQTQKGTCCGISFTCSSKTGKF